MLKTHSGIAISRINFNIKTKLIITLTISYQFQTLIQRIDTEFYRGSRGMVFYCIFILNIFLCISQNKNLWKSYITNTSLRYILLYTILAKKKLIITLTISYQFQTLIPRIDPEFYCGSRGMVLFLKYFQKRKSNFKNL